MKETIEKPDVSSPSLRNETVIGPNGAVTTSTALLANEKWGIGDPKRVERVTDGVYAMRGWGIASSFAIEAPEGWIIIDTGDYTRAAEEMRAKLEDTLGLSATSLVLARLGQTRILNTLLRSLLIGLASLGAS